MRKRHLDLKLDELTPETIGPLLLLRYIVWCILEWSLSAWYLNAMHYGKELKQTLLLFN